MKQTQLLMGMPITVEIVDPETTQLDVDNVFAYFTYIDDTFSTYKSSSEISQINRNELTVAAASSDVQMVLQLGEQTKVETRGFFDIYQGGNCDPSGIVKGWAIENAANQLKGKGFKNFYIDAGGDIQVIGLNNGQPWRVGIRNPFQRHENVKVLELSDKGIATSGTAIRGQHIYNPHAPDTALVDCVSITVIADNIYDADRFATAAFAMGKRGIYFIEDLVGYEGYMIDAQARATYTSGFERYVLPS